MGRQVEFLHPRQHPNLLRSHHVASDDFQHSSVAMDLPDLQCLPQLGQCKCFFRLQSLETAPQLCHGMCSIHLCGYGDENHVGPACGRLVARRNASLQCRYLFPCGFVSMLLECILHERRRDEKGYSYFRCQ